MATGLSNRIIARAPSAPSAPSVKGLGSGNNKGYPDSQPNSRANSQARNAGNQARANATSEGAKNGLGILEGFGNNPLALHASGPVNPGSLDVSSSLGGSAAPPDPRDAMYWQQIAQNNLNKTNTLNSLKLAEQEGNVGFERNMGNLAYRSPIELRELREQANAAGGIFSTATSERQGNLAQEQLMRRLGIEEEHTRSARELKEAENKAIAEYGTGVEEVDPITGKKFMNYGQQGNNAYEAAINRRINGG